MPPTQRRSRALQSDEPRYGVDDHAAVVAAADLRNPGAGHRANGRPLFNVPGPSVGWACGIFDATWVGGGPGIRTVTPSGHDGSSRNERERRGVADRTAPLLHRGVARVRKPGRRRASQRSHPRLSNSAGAHCSRRVNGADSCSSLGGRRRGLSVVRSRSLACVGTTRTWRRTNEGWWQSRHHGYATGCSVPNEMPDAIHRPPSASASQGCPATAA